MKAWRYLAAQVGHALIFECTLTCWPTGGEASVCASSGQQPGREFALHQSSNAPRPINSLAREALILMVHTHLGNRPWSTNYHLKVMEMQSAKVDEYLGWDIYPLNLRLSAVESDASCCNARITQLSKELFVANNESLFECLRLSDRKTGAMFLGTYSMQKLLLTWCRWLPRCLV